MVPPVAYMPFIIGSLPFIVGIVAIIMLFRYLLGKKQFEHQQIMAAIEKGTPLSELKPITQKKKEVDWIKSLTTGIAMLLIGTGWLAMKFINNGFSFPDPGANSGISIAALVLIAIGIAGIIRGILQRKADKEKLALDAKNGQ